MGLFAVSDNVQIATMLFGFLGTAFTAWIGYLMARLNKKADDAAEKVHQVAVATTEVKNTLAQSTDGFNHKLDSIAEIADKTHTLVNSAMGTQLRLHAETAEALASEQPHNKVFAAAAKEAKKLLKEHEAKQRIVDRKELSDET